ncbi:MAG: cobalamin-dependent protein [Methanocellales archaeon]|nr:cobalamin-dependent protein [Methanocellales archaeon]
MKILLCTPLEGYSTKPPMSPLGLAFIAGALERENYEVKILDNYLEKFNQESFLKRVRKYNPDVVGITCHAEDRFGAFETAKVLKEQYPNIKTVLGGPFPTVCHKQILEDIPSVDIVVRGEGEVTFLDSVKHIEKGKNLDDVRGITYRDEKKIKINDSRQFVKDLNELPWPAYHLLKIKEYPSYLSSFFSFF